MTCPACRTDNIPGTDLCEECGLDLAGLDVKDLHVDASDPVMALPLGELPLKEALVLEPTASVAEAIALMRERREGCVFVEDGAGRLVGTLTERDIASRVLNRSRNPGATPMHEVMTRDLVVLGRSDPLAWALHRMGVDGYRHLPVVDEGRLVGFLSMRTVLRVLPDVP